MEYTIFISINVLLKLAQIYFELFTAAFSNCPGGWSRHHLYNDIYSDKHFWHLHHHLVVCDQKMALKKWSSKWFSLLVTCTPSSGTLKFPFHTAVSSQECNPWLAFSPKQDWNPPEGQKSWKNFVNL